MNLKIENIESPGPQSKTVPLLDMMADHVVCRVPPQLRGKRFAMVSFGTCQFYCPYCLTGGYLPRQDTYRFPNAVDVPIERIKSFIEAQAKLGNPIKFTGGEPILQGKILIELVRLARSHGAYIVVDSNGAVPKFLIKLASEIDQVALDIKGPPRYVERVAGASLDAAWSKPLAAAHALHHLGNITLEIRTPIFGFTTFDDLIEIASAIPESAYWVIRRFLPAFEQNGVHANRTDCLPWLIQPSKDQIEAYYEHLLNKFPQLHGRLVSIMGNPVDADGVRF